MNAATRRLSELDVEVRFPATVVSTSRITPENSPEDVRELVLDVAVPADVRLEVGQSIGVLAPGDPALGATHHLRLYTIAGLPGRTSEGHERVEICVRRCTTLDPFTGERRPGIASHFLCDRAAGDTITLTGPYGLPFDVPAEHDANLILICAGTGIAPFRAFVKHLYQKELGFTGHVWLFHGGRTGLEMLYRNDMRDDFAKYYDVDTFHAFEVLSARPSWTDRLGWDGALIARGAELLRLLATSSTYVYVAGLEPMRDELDQVFTQLVGSEERWQRRKAELAAGGRWVELLY